jgi:hypothetical protein
LDFVGASHGVDNAGELNESAIPGILDDTSVMLSDFGIEKRLSESSQLRQRALFVDPHQAARARDIRRQNSRQSPLYVLAAQDAPPGLGEIECLHSTKVRRCLAMPSVRNGSNSEVRARNWSVRFTLKRETSPAGPVRSENCQAASV